MPPRFGPEPAPSEELFARIRAAVDATPAPRGATRARVAAALAVVPVASLAILVVASRAVYDRPLLRVDLGAGSSTGLLVELLVDVALTLAATAVALGRGSGGLGPGATRLLLVALLVAPAYALLSLTAPLFGPGADAATLAKLSPWGLRCLGIAAAVGAPTLIACAAALRRAAPVARRLRGAALGAAAGAWGGLGVFVFCPASGLPHLLIGHVLPVAAFTLLGLAALPRLLRP